MLTFLLDEQYGLCCYSELRADLELERWGYHIEHIQPKGKYPQKTFYYSNLAASALTSKDLKTIQGDTFGGHAKLSGYDACLFISCHDPDCSRYFAYLSDGRIVPQNNLTDYEKQRANYTINLLNLNCPYLVNHRKHWHEELDKLFEEHHSKGWSIKDLAEIHLLPTNRKLDQFFSLTRQFFGSAAIHIPIP